MTIHRDVDVCIIGGGTAGAAAAAHLRTAGMSVALIERDRCGAAASGVNFGGVRQQGRNPAELPMARRSRAIWSGIDRLLGVDTEFVGTGHMKLARSDADMADLEAYASTAREHGLELQLIGANRLRQDYPWLGATILGASLCAEDGQANPRVVAPAYARLARRLGAHIHEMSPVTAARRTEVGFEVEAGELVVKCRHLINTAGMGGMAIAALFGEVIPLTPLLPNMVVTEPVGFIAPQSIGVCGGDVYIRQIARGNVIFGGGRGVGDTGEWRSRPNTGATLAAMARALDVVPAFASAQIIRTWTGIDAETPDCIPVIGPSKKIPGLVHAVGFSGHGFQLGPAVGEILAELVSTGATPTPIAAFAVDRFAAAPPKIDARRFSG